MGAVGTKSSSASKKMSKRTSSGTRHTADGRMADGWRTGERANERKTKKRLCFFPSPCCPLLSQHIKNMIRGYRGERDVLLCFFSGNFQVTSGNFQNAHKYAILTLSES